MTREEAITILKDISWQMGSVKRWENIEAIDMAIEALTETSLKAIKKQIDEHWYLDKSDLISRADAIEAVASRDSTDGHALRFTGREITDILSALPSAKYITEKPNDAVKASNDVINRADAIDCCEDGLLFEEIIHRIEELPSAELPKGDLISRADVLKYPIRLDHYDEVNGSREFVYGVESVIEYVESLPSAETTGALDDAIAKYVADGYMLPPSADAVHGEWKFVDHEIFAGEYFCSICGKRAEVDLYGEWILSNYCGHCGARMENK